MSASKFLVLSPDKELIFTKPFSQVVKQTLEIQNTSTDKPMAFKVKTTAPKQYCVRPNSGKIAPGSSMQIQVLLQAMREDPPEDFKCKDKFLVQSITIPMDMLEKEGDEGASSISDLWAQADLLKKSDPEGAAEIMCEKKLKCTYANADTPTTPNLPLHTPSSSSSSPPPKHQPQREEERTNSTSEKELHEAREAIKRLTNACEGYKQEIERLNVTRKRRGVPEEKEWKRSDGEQVVMQGGLPMQMVALMVLAAFLLGVLFF